MFTPRTLDFTTAPVNSVHKSFLGVANPTICRMEDIKERRVRRLREWVEKMGGPRACERKFPKVRGVTESYLSGILNKHQPFGERAARAMEKRIELPSMYFDQDVEPILDPYTREVMDLLALMSLPQRDTAAAMVRSFADAIGLSPKKAAGNGH